MPEMRKTRRGVTRRASKLVQRGGLNSFEDGAAALVCQTKWLARRLNVSEPLARVVAELAFHRAEGWR